MKYLIKLKDDINNIPFLKYNNLKITNEAIEYDITEKEAFVIAKHPKIILVKVNETVQEKVTEKTQTTNKKKKKTTAKKKKKK